MCSPSISVLIFFTFHSKIENYIQYIRNVSQIVPKEVALERMPESRLRHRRLPKDVGTNANVVQRWTRGRTRGGGGRGGRNGNGYYDPTRIGGVVGGERRFSEGEDHSATREEHTGHPLHRGAHDTTFEGVQVICARYLSDLSSPMRQDQGVKIKD